VCARAYIHTQREKKREGRERKREFKKDRDSESTPENDIFEKTSQTKVAVF